MLANQDVIDDHFRPKLRRHLHYLLQYADSILLWYDQIQYQNVCLDELFLGNATVLYGIHQRNPIVRREVICHLLANLFFIFDHQ